ncbi:cell cycle control protein 50B [Brienomyrus brachyistius]|uniref:cell cycle control protein 50B n=1 Tax=Brienomyrus brachyistius TaxID=42636 RepID=UPI0020B4236F|nr:cell cycle control protein 50B [Brienomyrus brachyistius]XP_048831706.1 cell cycle control protein 50B [Brienomyrus brachyistius]XP_048831707.1 cell cycle control protein 50B [Brienomyrus brachyistius]
MKNQQAANRPDNTAFTQQRLPAWQPMLSAHVVIPGFLLIGMAFIGIGVALYITSQNIQVLEADYTGTGQYTNCSECANMQTTPCICNVTFSLTTLFTAPVFLYYGLSNYYQNYRKYGVSRDDVQLWGDPTRSPADACAPYQYIDSKPIAPCGSIANSMFNDTFSLYQIINGTKKEVPLDGKGIAWWTDYNIKFRNPTQGSLQDAFNGTMKPVNWSKPAYELDLGDPNNNGFLNQDFLVWMRTAALPDFRKLYRRITGGDYALGLPPGDYVLQIEYNYAVKDFGRKKVVLSNVTWMGGKNEFLGIAYLVVGSLCIVMSVVMLVVYAKYKFADENA